MTEEVKMGTVVWFNERRGLGFIAPDEGDKDLFVHYTNIVGEEGAFKTLTTAQRVEFVIGANNKGPQAEEVRVVAEPEE